ncbi:tetratricopeptide repeat protein [Pacificibacter marinus]|nr:tetratricopeptide repeat protein [Pacificibacter marinus]
MTPYHHFFPPHFFAQPDRSTALRLSFITTRLLTLVLFALSLSACSLSMPAGTGGSASGGSETLRLAQATSEAGDNETAARLFEKVLVSEPNSVPALLGAGNSYARMGQNSRAGAVLLRAHELAPNNTEALTTLGRVYLAQHQSEAAIEAYDKALRIDPRNVSALTGKGVALDTLSRHKQAQGVYEDGQTYYPTNFILRSNYALSLAISGDILRGTAILQELVKDPAAAPYVRGNLALVYGLDGRDNDARATLAHDMTPQEVQENIRTYQALRRMNQEGKPIGSLVFV